MKKVKVTLAICAAALCGCVNLRTKPPSLKGEGPAPMRNWTLTWECYDTPVNNQRVQWIASSPDLRTWTVIVSNLPYQTRTTQVVQSAWSATFWRVGWDWKEKR